MAPDAFISHSNEDRAQAGRVCELLEQRGLRCWIAPRDVGIGAEWDEAILDAIERSRVFLLILSAHANHSSFVKNELNRAFSCSKPIVTFRIEDVLPGRSLELYLARHHWTDAFPPPLEPKVEQLAVSLKGLLTPAGAAIDVDSRVPVIAEAASAPTPTPARVGATRGGEHAPHVSPALVGKALPWRLYAAWAAVILVALMAGFASRSVSPSVMAPRAAAMHLSIGLGAARLAGQAPVAISPDGTRMVFATGAGGLYLRDLAAREPVPLRGTEGAAEPFFSPDGEWVGFYSGGKLRKVAVSRGDPVTIADVASERGFSWSADGTIVFGGPNAPLMEVSDAGGKPRPLTTLDVSLGEGSHRWPFVLPGRRALLFAAGPAATANEWNSAHVVVQSLETGERRVVAARGTMPMYAAGYLIYVVGHTLVAQRFDLERLDVEGPVLTLIDDVERSVPGGGWFSVSGDAVLLHVRGPAPEPNKLAWVSRGGQLTPLPIPPALYSRPTLSPDGQRIVVTVSDPDSDIWTFDVASGGSTRITNDGTSLWPLWTPDGARIVYSSTRISEQGGVNLYQSRSDGSGNEELLLSTGTTNRAESWAPGGDLAFMQLSLVTGSDLMAIHPGAQPTVLKRSRFEENTARFSPDGRWMAYLATETGRAELYVQPLPLGSGEPVQISSTGAESPVWSKDGGELFFSRGNEVWAALAPRRPGDAFGAARVLTSGPFILDTGFDVSADGRFLVVTRERDRMAPVQIDVTLNWASSLQRGSGQDP